MTDSQNVIQDTIDDLMRDLHRAVNIMMATQVVRGSDLGILIDHPDITIDPYDRTDSVIYHGPTVSLSHAVPLGEIWEKQHGKMFRSEYFTRLYYDMVYVLRHAADRRGQLMRCEDCGDETNRLWGVTQVTGEELEVCDTCQPYYRRIRR